MSICPLRILSLKSIPPKAIGLYPKIFIRRYIYENLDNEQSMISFTHYILSIAQPLCERTTSIVFAENQLSPSPIGLSPLPTDPPRFLLQPPVRSLNCPWLDHLVSGNLTKRPSRLLFTYILLKFAKRYLINPLYKRYTVLQLL